MKQFVKTIQVTIKGILYWLRPHLYLSFLSKPALLFHNVIQMSKWIQKNKQANILDDFFTFKRDHQKCYELYDYILKAKGLDQVECDYIELGVYQGQSFKWWVEHNTHPNSRFYGFDTFEGLPEDWGLHFKKGSMNAVSIPSIQDDRAQFIKGLFQDTIPGFLQETPLNNGKRKIIHFDADLFSSTLYGLGMLSVYLKPGDIVLFDEFNVPNSEFYALKMFEDSYYREFKLIAAVNNYYQIAMEVVK